MYLLLPTHPLSTAYLKSPLRIWHPPVWAGQNWNLPLEFLIAIATAVTACLQTAVTARCALWQCHPSVLLQLGVRSYKGQPAVGANGWAQLSGQISWKGAVSCRGLAARERSRLQQGLPVLLGAPLLSYPNFVRNSYTHFTDIAELNYT